MSFDRYVSKSILHKLQDDRPPPTTSSSSSSSSSSQDRFHIKAPSTVNLMHRATLGLQRLHAEIIAHRKWSFQRHGSAHSQYFTDEHGFLQSQGNFAPLICKRYKVIEMIGQGSFSQVFSVDDTFLEKRKVALKIIRKGCEVLGRREKIFLQHLMEDNRRGPHYFMECFGWLEFSDHMALILPHYSQTLLTYIYDSEPSPSSNYDQIDNGSFNTSNLFLPPAPPVVPLLQPKAISKHGLSQSSVKHTSNAPSSSATPHKASPKPSLLTSPNVIPTKPVEPLPSLESGDINNLRKIAFQLVSALFILHKEGIIHGDIKPENRFVCTSDQGNVVHDDHDNSNSVKFASTSSSSSAPTKPRLSEMAKDFTIKLGDFGNSIHLSEVKQYFKEFEIQSLPYRAPEVLIGQNFNTAIDMWSLGIMLLELCINKPLFMPTTRMEAIQGIAQKIEKFDSMKFSGGLYSNLLFENSSTILTIKRATNKEFNNLTRQENVKAIKRIVSKSTEILAPNHEVFEMLDFISACLSVDPSHRLTAKEAFLHPFLLTLLNLPLSIVNENFADQNISKKRKLSTINAPFQSLRNDSHQRFHVNNGGYESRPISGNSYR